MISSAFLKLYTMNFRIRKVSGIRNRRLYFQCIITLSNLIGPYSFPIVYDYLVHLRTPVATSLCSIWHVVVASLNERSSQITKPGYRTKAENNSDLIN